MTKKKEKKGHSSVGGSSAARWILCPGSRRECENLSNDSSAYADEGTAAHALGEIGLNKRRLVTMSDKKSVEKKFRKYVNEDMIDFVNSYIQTVLDTFAEQEGNALHVEVNVDLSHIHPEMRGTLDAVVVEPFGTIHVFDLKYGLGKIVSAKRNEQGMFYAVGAVFKFFESIFEEVNIVIVQPRVSDYPSSWRISIDELEGWEANTLAPAVKATDDPKAPLVFGDHCSDKFCAAFKQATCPAAQGEVSNTIGADVTTIDPTELTLPDPTGLGSKELSNILNVSGLIAKWLKNVEAMAKERLISGIPVPGRKLVEGRQGNRAWRDEQEVVDSLTAVKGVESIALYEPAKLKSPAKLEKLKSIKGTEAAKLIKNLTCRSPGNPSMVADTDPKPALEMSVEKVEDEYNFINDDIE